ncbi:hypothetical protein ACFLZ8_00990 [Planctomycetota bacterium]
MQRIVTILFLVFYLSIYSSGCTQIRNESGEIEQQTQLSRDGTLYDVMETAEDVLAQMHFTFDKIDYRTGYIKTRPLPGAQFFEFWRSDNVGPDNSLVSNLYSIRRTAEIYISTYGDDFLMNCDVQVQRLSLPNRDIDSSAQVYEMFSMSSQSLQTLQLRPEQQQDMAWIDLDPDTQLAEEILIQIRSRITGKMQQETSSEL